MDKITTDTYNRAAKAYAEKFAGIGVRLRHIEKSFAAFGGENPKVLELGCGDGRDAVEIYKWTDQYLGIDISKEMITLAKEKVPKGNFEVMSIEEYPFVEHVDVIFAFASLLHVNKEAFENFVQKAREVLPVGGIFLVSVKRGEYKGPEVVKDDYGERVFYYYQESDIRKMAKGFEIVLNERMVRGHTTWIDIILKKI